MNNPRIIVALDFSNKKQALELAGKLDKNLCRIKIGKELFTIAGPQLIEQLMACGFEIFLDLKYHDIPNTVAGACRAASDLGVWMINVHALGGRKMLIAAQEALSTKKTKLIAVTLLTSLNKSDLNEIGLNEEPINIVQRLALLASDCGLDGVVCSALEAPQLRGIIKKDFCLVTPGIRPLNCSANDQMRITTPQEAIQNGANYLVIGRPITQSPDPLLALQRLNHEIETIGCNDSN
ncbi:orotidine-5'-phosphate decarboxylase [Nitrosomonas sp. Nm132]|jgi:orotidine-5'-phosphate decarboxylase|uniref:orotidine-5'-phosphate decarboxylase n=1 Tax=Nitrosomonas sp. Nm132 TaxID=1881053 RepID=UPI00088773CB|nr:orotidine-5'-phosphate decarboxylase [Nitrosomonas sp. Nm132]SDH52252.1 orotidine-5'-phosphate decarboxylase [Nitrosomonas sp. Nm132]